MMKRDVLIPVLFILLGISVLAIIGLKLTGFVSWAPDFEGIFRSVPFKNIETNTTDVYIRIASLENVLAIEESFSSPECKVLDYSLDKDISIFEFNENENTWIIADNSDYLDVELFYSIHYDCDVVSGRYYTVNSFAGNNWCNGADINKDSQVNAADYMLLKNNFGYNCNATDWCNGADINKNGKVDYSDLQILQTEVGNSGCSESPDESIKTSDLKNCYQESADKASEIDGNCGLNYNGSYGYTSSENKEKCWKLKDCVSDCRINLFDGDWDTKCDATASCECENDAIYIDYAKPANALSSSLWQIKGEAGVMNLEIPEECWNAGDKIHFEVWSTDNLELLYYQTVWKCCADSNCYNEIEMKTIDSPDQNPQTAHANIYEEAMIWKLNSSTILSAVSQNNSSGDSNVNYGSTSSTGSSGSGSGGSSGGITAISSSAAINTNEIAQVSTNEEYEAQSLSATEKLAQISEEVQLENKYSGYLIAILAIIAIAIVGFIVFSLFRRPKSFA